MQAREARLGQDVAKVRLSPEKGHLGARGGVCGTPRWLTGACPAPPTSSGTALLRGGRVPGGDGRGVITQVSCSFGFRLRGAPIVSWWRARWAPHLPAPKPRTG